MNFTPRPLSTHRRARLIAWALAMLVWLAQVWFGAALLRPRHARQRASRMSLVGLKRMVKKLIIVRAIDLARRRWRAPRKRAYRGRAIALPNGVIRALIGAQVHHKLKRRQIGECIAVLIHALHHLDAYAALVAKRLKRGLTRRWLALFALPRAPDARVASLAALAAFTADSS